jgi:signal peptidase I
MRVATATNDVAGGEAPGHVRALARTAATVLLWLSVSSAVAILGGISLLSVLGFRLMVVTGPSMVPRFGPGDAVVIRSSGSSGVGVRDVITYRTPGTDGLTTHRVVEVIHTGETTWFRTKGDANPAVDPNLTSADNVFGRELMTLPGMGRPLLFAVSPWGKLAMLGFPVCYLIAQEAAFIFALAGRRQSAALQEEPAQDDASTERLSDLAWGLEARVGRDSAEVAELDERLERTEAELRAQAFRLAALAAALVRQGPPGGESGQGREPERRPAEAGSLLVLP